MITPTKEVKAMVFQLNEEQTLFFWRIGASGLCERRQTFFRLLYVQSSKKIHRTKLEKKANDLYENHLGELLTPPSGEELKEFPELVKHEFTIHERKKRILYSLD
ncbi:hypothetical protein GCM10020331_038170 [Ectobacillus funiculus]